MNILMTGASGFVGKSLSAALKSHHHDVSPLTHSQFPTSLVAQSYDCLIHLAGRAHVMHETAADIYQAYKEVNVDYTLKVALLAQSLGVKRFVFLSSLKVNGEVSSKPFTELDSPAPTDAYGQTKLEAELLLQDFCLKNDMELVIIRPPLIYGAGVKANFKALIQLCNKPIPLPFGNIRNKRSLISLDNLNDFIECCCQHPKAANQTFVISDDFDVSTTELIYTIKCALHRKSLLIPVPQNLLRLFLNITRKQTLVDRLLGDLQVDITKSKQLLNWQPVVNFKQGVQNAIID